MARPSSDSAYDPLAVKQLPYSMEAEQAVLGAVIIDSEKMGEVSALLRSEDFFVEKHAMIFDAAYGLFSENSVIDPVTLLNELDRRDVYTKEAGNAYIRQLAENTPSISNVMDYARIVRDKALLRKLIRAAEKISENAYTQTVESEPSDAQGVLDSAEQMIYNLSRGAADQDFVHIKELVREYYGVLNVLMKD